MAYHRYQTAGIVVSGRDAGESSRSLTLYTREFGLIPAWAQGVRELSSKLKPGTQRMAESEFEMVRGKGMWRIVDARPRVYRPHLTRSPRALAAAARLLDLVARVTDEGSDPELFAIQAGALDAFERDVRESGRYVPSIEVLALARTLCHLGYLPEAGLSGVKPFDRWSPDVVAAVAEHRQRYVMKLRYTIAHLHLSSR